MCFMLKLPLPAGAENNQSSANTEETTETVDIAVNVTDGTITGTQSATNQK